MNAAMKLINAVQSCDVRVLENAIAETHARSDAECAHLKGHERKWARAMKNPFNDQLPGMGLTALHVAAKAYSAHMDDPSLAVVFDKMVGMLLDAGASPHVELPSVYRRQSIPTPIPDRRGMTVVEVCEGRVPPTLAAWFEQLPSDESTAAGPSQVEVHPCSPNAATAARRKERNRLRKSTVRKGDRRELIAAD